MLLTLADVLALEPVLAGDPVHVAGGGLDRPVRWVHVSDVTRVSDLLRGGEIVLTTGAALARGDADSIEYLRSFADAGVSALVVEFGLYITKFSDAVIRTADELGLPLIALRTEARFVEITEAVHRIIVADQYAEVEFARRVHEVFTDLSMRRASLNDIVATAAELLHDSAVLEDLSHQVLAFAAVDVSAAELLEHWENRSRTTLSTSSTTDVEASAWVTTEVGPHTQPWGLLVLPEVRESTPRRRMVIERTAQALSLSRMIEKDQVSLEQQAQSGLIEDILRGDIDTERDALARARALSMRSGVMFVPLVIRVLRREISDPVDAQRHTRRILDALAHSLRSTSRSALVSIRRAGELNVILSIPDRANTRDYLTAACALIHTEALRIPTVSTATIGVGTESTRLVAAVLSLGEAAHVAEVAMSLGSSTKPFYRAVDVRLRGLLSMMRDDARIQRFAEAELGSLIEYDIKNRTDQMKLLTAFLAMNGNKTELAKSLNLSRPTLYSRLAAIERVLGVSLDDGESRTSLHTALLFRETRSRFPSHES